MKRLLLYLVAPLLLALTAFSCDKDEDLEVMEATAILQWTGDYAVDGCGYSIYLNEQYYKPDNEGIISDEFKKEESHTVRIKYALPSIPEEYTCGWGLKKKNKIRLLSVKEI